MPTHQGSRNLSDVVAKYGLKVSRDKRNGFIVHFSDAKTGKRVFQATYNDLFDKDGNWFEDCLDE